MIHLLFERLRQKQRTLDYPQEAPALSERFSGRPVLDSSKCKEGCKACLQSCPTQAIAGEGKRPTLTLDLGRCLFCTECVTACPERAIAFTPDFRLATTTREDLVIREGRTQTLAHALEKKMLRLFGRSLRLRQVSAAGCNGCEVEVNVLQTVVFDLARFGIEFVSSPRHADGLIITGPVSQAMKEPLLKTWEAMPEPKIVIAVGACAISGGPYMDHPEVLNGPSALLPVDLFIPGCPPHPMTILDGLLRLLNRLEPHATR